MAELRRPGKPGFGLAKLNAWITRSSWRAPWLMFQIARSRFHRGFADPERARAASALVYHALLQQTGRLLPDMTVEELHGSLPIVVVCHVYSGRAMAGVVACEAIESVGMAAFVRVDTPRFFAPSAYFVALCGERMAPQARQQELVEKIRALRPRAGELTLQRRH